MSVRKVVASATEKVITRSVHLEGATTTGTWFFQEGDTKPPTDSEAVVLSGKKRPWWQGKGALSSMRPQDLTVAPVGASGHEDRAVSVGTSYSAFLELHSTSVDVGRHLKPRKFDKVCLPIEARDQNWVPGD